MLQLHQEYEDIMSTILYMNKQYKDTESSLAPPQSSFLRRILEARTRQRRPRIAWVPEVGILDPIPGRSQG